MVSIILGIRAGAVKSGESVPMIRLHDLEVSGNCYKVRLFLALLGIAYEKVPVNTRRGDQKRPEFLARKHAPQWYPTEPREAAEVARWVAISQQAEITVTGLSRARAITLFGVAGNLADFQERGRHFLRFLDGHLAGRTWLALERPTIGDLACYPYIALAPDGGVSLDEYASLQKWFARIRALPGYVELPKATPENIAVASGPTGPGLKK